LGLDIAAQVDVIARFEPEYEKLISYEKQTSLFFDQVNAAVSRECRAGQTHYVVVNRSSASTA
jgi:hypothetical protein